MQKVKQTKKECKTKRRNYLWQKTRLSVAVSAYSIAGAEYIGGDSIPFIRIG